jgi:hypothetical protein
MKIIIEFSDKWAVVLIGTLTVLGWLFSYALVYTTYFLTTGQDPLSWLSGIIPQQIYDVLKFLGVYGGYVMVFSGAIATTIISALIIKRNKGK